jgi:hypothetical protein
MTTQQHVTQGDGVYHLSAAAALLVIGEYAYEDFDETVPAQPNRLRDLVGRVLSMAAAGGFAKSDILLTMISKHERSSRMLSMAQEVVDHMGGDLLFVEFMHSARAAQKGAQ